MPIIAIAHPADRVACHYHADDLARLARQAEVRVLGTQDADAVARQLKDVDVLTGAWGMPPLTDRFLEQAPRLRAVCYAAGSVKRFVTPAVWSRGLIVTTAMHANAIPVAEVTVALITLINKNWFRCQRGVHADGRPGLDGREELRHRGNFGGTTVGIVGFGAIGRLVVQRLRTLDVTVVVADPHADPAAVAAAGATLVDLVECARRSHVLSLHAPDIPACEHMIDARVLAALPDGATLINTARGRLVDEAALIAELSTGRIDAHLDVTHPEPPDADSPLWRLPNCWLTPHRAGSSGHELQRMGRSAVDACLAVLDGRDPPFRVHERILATSA